VARILVSGRGAQEVRRSIGLKRAFGWPPVLRTRIPSIRATLFHAPQKFSVRKSTNFGNKLLNVPMAHGRILRGCEKTPPHQGLFSLSWRTNYSSAVHRSHKNEIDGVPERAVYFAPVGSSPRRRRPVRVLNLPLYLIRPDTLSRAESEDGDHRHYPPGSARFARISNVQNTLALPFG